MSHATAEELHIAGYFNYIQHMTDCWSRDLCYADYKMYAEHLGEHVVPEESYKLHCQAMDIALETNIGANQEEMDPVEAAEANLRAQGIAV